MGARVSAWPFDKLSFGEHVVAGHALVLPKVCALFENGVKRNESRSSAAAGTAHGKDLLVGETSLRYHYSIFYTVLSIIGVDDVGGNFAWFFHAFSIG